MSRVIVKNLPKNITEEKLRELFSQKGLVTDVQLKYTSDGKFRQFCFIGYQEESEANAAIGHFHNTRINTNKISVQQCALLGDGKKTKQGKNGNKNNSELKTNKVEKGKNKNKNNSECKSKEVDKLKNKLSDDLIEKYKDDPMFEEFLEVHDAKEIQNLLLAKQKEKTKPESNEDSGKDSEVSEDEEENEADDKISNKNVSDMEYMKMLMEKSKESKPRQKMEKKVKERIDLYTLKLRNLPYNIKKRDIKLFFKPLIPYTIRLPRNIKSIAYVGFKQESHFNKGLLKDKSIIAGKQISVMKYTSEISTQDQKQTLQNTKWKTQEESLKNEEDIAESGRIFIRNLAYTSTEEDIQNLFGKFGPIVELNLPIDSTTRKPKGFGVITFLIPEHAVAAYSELDGSILHGRMVHLLPGKPKDGDDNQNEESSNFKDKKAKKQKSQAGSSHNWNSLFLGHDAVAEVIAQNFGTSKEAVLAPHGDGSAAVRLALGETQIVATTRKYLQEQGVVLDVFSDATAKRSKTIILVKNLPAHTEAIEIRKLFEPHGILGRIVFPPSGITAIVEFIEPSEARKAFTRLAYSKFKNLPLYLEWAPENSLQSKETSSKKVEEKTVECKVVAIEENEEEEEEEEEPEDDTTLFVKNLDFKTTDSVLKKHFQVCGKIHYATVAMKKDPNDYNNKLSMGYGFVRFIHKASADKALKMLQQSQLEGKSLELKRSERTLQNDVKATKKVSKKVKQTGSKILVRNIPFQANRKEIMELFKTFGEIKALRLPKKMAVGVDSHRGFAFVDFTTNADAKKAFEALCQSTHLYGRRLVLEWASSEDGVEEIRKRTAEHFCPTNEVKSKKSTFDIDAK